MRSRASGSGRGSHDGRNHILRTTDDEWISELCTPPGKEIRRLRDSSPRLRNVNGAPFGRSSWSWDAYSTPSSTHSIHAGEHSPHSPHSPRSGSCANYPERCCERIPKGTVHKQLVKIRDQNRQARRQYCSTWKVRMLPCERSRTRIIYS